MNSMRLRRRQPRLKLSPEEYALLRNQVLERDGWRCQDCGAMKNLQVHHIKRRSQLGGDLAHNLITLCASCHKREHGR
jgi:5-methylcytosine-specific restriction endonuclease McrA